MVEPVASSHQLEDGLSVKVHLIALSYPSSEKSRDDGNLVRLLRGHVLRRNVRIPLASMSKFSHIDLKHAEGRTLDAVEVELSQEVIALGHCTFGLEYLDEYS